MEEYNFETLTKQHYRYCMSKIRQRTSDIDLAEDAYREALAIFWIKYKRQELKNEKNIPAFVCTIALRILAKWQDKANNTVQIDERSHAISTSTDEKEENGSFFSTQINQAFNRLGEQCKKLLTAKYVYQHKYKEIAEDFSFKSADVVKTQTNRCLKKLRSFFVPFTKNESH